MSHESHFIIYCAESGHEIMESFVCSYKLVISLGVICGLWLRDPDNKVHGANMGPTWVLSAPDGPHVGPMNFAIRGVPQDTMQG